MSEFIWIKLVNFLMGDERIICKSTVPVRLFLGLCNLKNLRNETITPEWAESNITIEY